MSDHQSLASLRAELETRRMHDALQALNNLLNDRDAALGDVETFRAALAESATHLTQVTTQMLDVTADRDRLATAMRAAIVHSITQRNGAAERILATALGTTVAAVLDGTDTPQADHG